MPVNDAHASAGVPATLEPGVAPASAASAPAYSAAVEIATANNHNIGRCGRAHARLGQLVLMFSPSPLATAGCAR
jgi:hypothetical protein